MVCHLCLQVLSQGYHKDQSYAHCCFFIYIDDITQVNLSAASRLVLYADDILLYRPIFSSFEDYRILQSDIDALANWTTSNSMSFNVSKCKSMIISRKKNHGSSFPPLILNGSILDVVPTFKYLGVLFSSKLVMVGSHPRCL